MKKTALRIMTIFSVLVCMNGYISLRLEARAEEGALLSGRVVYVDQDRGFIIFDIGRDEGVEKNSIFDVYHDSTRIGEVKTVKVRAKFTAADVECFFNDTFVRVGDTVEFTADAGFADEDIQMERSYTPASVGLLAREESILLEQAEEYFNDERYLEAQEKIDTVLEFDPENKQALRILQKIDDAHLQEEVGYIIDMAQTDFSDGAYEAAAEGINAALQLDPRNKEALRLADEVDAALLRQKTENLYQEAVQIFEEEKYEEARDKLKDDLLALDPENARGLRLLAEVEKVILDRKINEMFIPARKYFNEMEFELAQEKIDEILTVDPKNKKALKMQEQLESRLNLVLGLDAETISVDINAPMHSIFVTARDILKKYGCMITFSDSQKYNLRASKYKNMPLFNRIMNEERQVTRNKVYYTVELKPSVKSDVLMVNRLLVHIKGVHDREGEVRNYRIKRSSAAYKEAQEMVCSIKYLAENL